MSDELNLPNLPPVDPKPFAYAIAALQQEADFWTGGRAADPEHADKVVRDCKEAIEVLTEEGTKLELMRKIFGSDESEKFLPSGV